MNWRKISLISGCSGGAVALINIFVIKKYIPFVSLALMTLECLGVLLLITSEVIIFIKKLRPKQILARTRIVIIHRWALAFLCSSLGLYLINDGFLHKKIPLEIIGYILFLSIGFYVGFHVCLSEIKRERSTTVGTLN